jgi:hypothetical protein
MFEYESNCSLNNCNLSTIVVHEDEDVYQQLIYRNIFFEIGLLLLKASTW